MKRNTKKLLTLAVALLLVFGLLACAGCGAAKDASTRESIAAHDYAIVDEDAASAVTRAYGNSQSAAPRPTESASQAADSTAPADTEEKIIRTVDLQVQTETFDAYVQAMNAAIRAAGGYVEESSTDAGGYDRIGFRSAYLVARIPSTALDAFLAKAGEQGVILSREESAVNVTLDYVDLESRIAAYKTEQTTLLGLLEKATSLEDILKIQERLSAVNYELESYSAKLRVLENRVSYATVTLNVDEVRRALQEEDGLGTRIKNRFLENWDGLKDWLKDLVVGLIGGLPILLPLAAAIAVAVIVLIKLGKKRREKKRAKYSADPPEA